MKNVLVIGATTNPDRYGNIAVKRLLNANQNVKAIGNKNGEINGIKIETEKIHFEDIDTVTLYINPVRQKEYYDYIISLKPRRVIFNPGTENLEFYELLQQNDIEVEVACTLVLLATNQY